jgi:hypothetical protein
MNARSLRRHVLVTVAGMWLMACGASNESPAISVELFIPTQTPAPTFTPVPALTPTPLPSPTPEGACAIQTLPIGMVISASGSYTLTETEAAGPMICQIRRDACEFKLLLRNLDPELFFQNEEPVGFNDEDQLMHPAMLKPLTELKRLVQQKWRGEVRLIVTDAYDSLLEHDLAQPDPARKVALHFEGRSIDFVPQPATPERMEQLCAMAHCAGFDWVHNEVTHCHASVNAPSLCGRCQ